MKLIKPSVEILEQAPGLQGIYDMIELCGKTSYKSPVKGGDEAKKFVDARINEGHFAVLEFGTVYLKVPPVLNHQKYEKNPYSKVRKYEGFYYITTNYRVIIENGWEKDLQWMCEPTDMHCKRYTARFITDRGVTHEIVRHRVFSFCQESTRYCNYSKNKFGNELTFILPPWIDRTEEEANAFLSLVASGAMLNEEGKNTYPFYSSLKMSEHAYLQLLENGWTPQQARQVLPNALKTEICMCGFEDAWRNFFDLRYRGTTGKPHPDMLNVATMLHKEFENRDITL